VARIKRWKISGLEWAILVVALGGLLILGMWWVVLGLAIWGVAVLGLRLGERMRELRRGRPE
jgi:hypothetical protein